FACTFGSSTAYQREWLGQKVAAPDASDGSEAHRSRLEREAGAVVLGFTRASAARGGGPRGVWVSHGATGVRDHLCLHLLRSRSKRGGSFVVREKFSLFHNAWSATNRPV